METSSFCSSFFRRAHSRFCPPLPFVSLEGRGRTNKQALLEGNECGGKRTKHCTPAVSGPRGVDSSSRTCTYTALAGPWVRLDTLPVDYSWNESNRFKCCNRSPPASLHIFSFCIHDDAHFRSSKAGLDSSASSPSNSHTAPAAPPFGRFYRTFAHASHLAG